VLYLLLLLRTGRLTPGASPRRRVYSAFAIALAVTLS